MHFSLLVFVFFVTTTTTITIAEHVTVTYHFWEKNPEIVEKVEWFTRFVANSNRFWTSNLVYLQHGEQTDKIQISSESWKSANIEETVTFPLDEFFVSIFQKFADKLYTNRALDSLPVFDPSVFKNSYHAYEEYEVNAENEENFKFDYWLKIAGDEAHLRGNRHVFALLTRKESFEHWEAILSFVDALKRSGQRGYIVDCGKANTICPSNIDHDNPALYVFKDDDIQKVYDGDFQKDHVYTWMLTIKQPEIKMLKEETVPKYRSGIIPGFDRPQDTVTILFIHTKKSQIWRNYVKFAKENHGKYHLSALVSEEVRKWAIYPAFITMKPQDNYVKAFTLHKDIHWNRMVDFLEDGVHPSCHPLNYPSEFLFATSSKKPLVLFFDPLDSKNVTRFKIAASQELTSERTAHYAAVSGLDLFGLYIMSVFNVNTSSYVSINRLERGWCIHKRAIENDDFLSVKSWVRNLEPANCQELIEDFKFPISRLALLERYEDVDELEKEHTEIERNHDEL